MWKIQRHKCYGMTIANSYGTTKDINSYGKKKTLTFVKYLNQKHLHTKHGPQSFESINW